ncbi:MAG TPA: class I SAM-dependent methyltransferase [Candidatus Sulfomarinibacteraceae bacterium]|nr:class I SAM-dependent methyltransferase [Candidatus Sulfomarinibacteraceae bacterium]
METWKYFDITHAEHTICNPSSLEKFRRLVTLLRLQPNARVLELACGKGEFLAQLAEAYAISAVGVDLSPYCIRDARALLAERAADADVTLLEMDGADYEPETPQGFDLTVCLGASWIFDGHRGTLAGLQQMTRPGGQIVVGEPYWRQEPAPQYLEMAGMARDDFGSHYENVVTGQALGLKLLHTIVSSEDDWDVYEGLQWYASERYALANPDDPDVPELLSRQREQQQEYLQYGRDTLGWAIYLFRN